MFLPLIGELCLVQQTLPARHNEIAPCRGTQQDIEHQHKSQWPFKQIAPIKQNEIPKGQLSCPKIRLLHNNNNKQTYLIYLKGLKILGGCFSLWLTKQWLQIGFSTMLDPNTMGIHKSKDLWGNAKCWVFVFWSLGATQSAWCKR